MDRKYAETCCYGISKHQQSLILSVFRFHSLKDPIRISYGAILNRYSARLLRSQHKLTADILETSLHDTKHFIPKHVEWTCSKQEQHNSKRKTLLRHEIPLLPSINEAFWQRYLVTIYCNKHLVDFVLICKLEGVIDSDQIALRHHCWPEGVSCCGIPPNRLAKRCLNGLCIS